MHGILDRRTMLKGIGASGGTLDVSQSSGNPTLSFAISGPGTLTKTGKTTIQVSGNNSFGQLQIVQGRYNVFSNTAAGSGTITLAGLSGGTAVVTLESRLRANH